MKNIRFWFKKNFGKLSIEECIKLDLRFYSNVYGDEINNLNCRSIWVNNKGKKYRCESLYDYVLSGNGSEDSPFKIL